MDKKELEPFVSESDIIQDIIDIYYKTLQRAPTSDELKTHTKAVKTKEYDYREIELRLINSDEYQRLMRTQTNTLLSPETKRMVEEKDLITLIKIIYKKIRNRKLKKELYLPLKDMYIYFDYNLYKFVALLRESKYSEFEDEILKDVKLSRESLIELYLKMFDDTKLNYDAAALEKMDKSLSKGKRLIDLVKAEEGAPIDESSVNTAALLAFLMSNVKNIEKKDEAGAELDSKKSVDQRELDRLRKELYLTTSKDSCTASQRIYLPNESKILKTEYGFSVLEKHPPVCIPVGKPNTVSEPIIYSTLQGTPLSEATDTQIGSIMPKFEYRRYIDIPVPGTTIPPKKQKSN